MLHGVYQAGDTAAFHRRALEILEAAADSAAVLAHHALAAGLAQAAFRHSLAAGRKALRISAVSEAIVHFERARQLVLDESPAEVADEADLRDLYLLSVKAYELGGQTEKAEAIDAERNRLG
jgi:predicted ATPase